MTYQQLLFDGTTTTVRPAAPIYEAMTNDPRCATADQRDLLLTVTITPEQGKAYAYSAMYCLAANIASHRVALQELILMRDHERTAMLAYLDLHYGWQAWARTEPAVRAVLGVHEPLETVDQLSPKILIPRPTIKSAIHSQRLPALKIGRIYYLYATTIERAIAEGVMQAPQPSKASE